MKIWETDGQGGVHPVSSTQEYNKPFVLVDSAQEASGEEDHYDPNWIEKVIEKEWPDNTLMWDRQCQRSTALCRAPGTEEHRCGSFGPAGRTCQRLDGHRGKCSDIFLPEDKENVTQRLRKLKMEEMDEILGINKACGVASKKLDREKLKAILKRENHGS